VLDFYRPGINGKGKPCIMATSTQLTMTSPVMVLKIAPVSVSNKFCDERKYISPSSKTPFGSNRIRNKLQVCIAQWGDIIPGIMKASTDSDTGIL